MSETISVKNLGPIPDFTFKLDDYGVSVLTAPNGSGKSILLNAVQKAALGTGKLPLRDGQRRGSVEVGDCIITVGATTRYNGEFQIKNLESRLPLSALVDPGMKDAKAADRHRIKALVALTGVAATRELFTKHEALADFNSVVTEDATKTDDLVEMAARVKRDYEAKAREAEKDADREEGHVRGLEEAASGIDLEAESDAEQLQAEYDASRDAHAKLEAEIENHNRRIEDAQVASGDLDKLQTDYAGKTVGQANGDLLADVGLLKQQTDRVKKLQDELDAQKQLLETYLQSVERSELERDRAVEFANSVTALQATIDRVSENKTEFASTEDTQTKVWQAKAAQELGVKIRDAVKKLDQAEAHKDAAAAARKRAERLRSAAGAVDEVLSDAIKSDVLKVDIQDGAARLVVNHPQRGEKTHYHELSMGERWCIAIGLGADRVGEGGLLVVEQDAWESLDAFVRPLIHQHAVERRVFVLTAEATRDPDDGTEMQAKSFAEASNA